MIIFKRYNGVVLDTFDCIIVGGGLAGMLLANELSGRMGRVAVIEPNFGQAVPPWFLVHRFPGKRLALDSVSIEAFECTNTWLRGLSDDCDSTDVVRVGPMLRPQWASNTSNVPLEVNVLSCDELWSRYPQVVSDSGSCLLYYPAWSGFGGRVVGHLKATFLRAGGVWVDGSLLSAQSLKMDSAACGGWSVSTSVGAFYARRLVLALGANLRQWLPWSGLGSNSGSLMQCSLEINPLRNGLDVAVSSGGHIAPLPDGTFVVGSTYRHDVSSAQDILEKEEKKVLKQIARRLVSLQVDERTCRCWSGDRATVPQDKQPVVGAIPESEGLFVFGGLASKGFFWAPWLASQLAGQIVAGTSSLPKEFSPQRVKGYRPIDRLSRI